MKLNIYITLCRAVYITYIVHYINSKVNLIQHIVLYIIKKGGYAALKNIIYNKLDTQKINLFS